MLSVLRKAYRATVYVLTLIELSTCSSVSPIPRSSITVNRNLVPFPPGVVGVDPESCTWTRDGVAIVCPFVTTTHGEQIGLIKPDGSGYQCITCNSTIPGPPGYLNTLPDKKSVYYGAQSGLLTPSRTFVPQILECTPSLLDCQSVVIRNVTVPT